MATKTLRVCDDCLTPLKPDKAGYTLSPMTNGGGDVTKMAQDTSLFAEFDKAACLKRFASKVAKNPPEVEWNKIEAKGK